MIAWPIHEQIHRRRTKKILDQTPITPVTFYSTRWLFVDDSLGSRVILKACRFGLVTRFGQKHAGSSKPSEAVTERSTNQDTQRYPRNLWVQWPSQPAFLHAFLQAQTYMEKAWKRMESALTHFWNPACDNLSPPSDPYLFRGPGDT